CSRGEIIHAWGLPYPHHTEEIPRESIGEVLPASRRRDGMDGSVLTLDTILSATFHRTREWSEHLVSNQARDLLRFVIIKLYEEGQGNLINATWTQAQTTLAKKLKLSRKWVGELTARLEEQGWIEHYAPKRPDGMNGSTIWRAGGQLKRLIIAITKSHLKHEKRR